MKKEIMNASEIRKVINRLAYELIEKEDDLSSCALIGIRSRGDIVAKRIKTLIKKSENYSLDLGILDITLYRDDLAMREQIPIVKETDIPFSIEARNLIIVDDVLQTGRTIRAAMEAIFDYGRPKSIKLLTLLDRGGRQLPIFAEYVGIRSKIKEDEFVITHLKESDGEDSIFVKER